MAVTHVAFIMYPVTDLPKAVAFYRDGLGLKQEGLASDYWVEFDAGGTTFGVGNFEQVGKPGSAQSLALEVADMAAFRAELAGKGIESTEPYETPVCFMSFAKDPDGNSVVIHQAKHA
jgi:predicted enzyme related to lactoylglutathione lyase